MAFIATFGAANADAHTRSQSRSTWWLDGDHVSAVFAGSALDVTRLGEIAFDDLPLVYADHLSDTVAVRRGDVECRLTKAPTVLPAEPGFVRAELALDCASPTGTRTDSSWEIEVRTFLGVASSHLHMAAVHVGDAAPLDLLFSDSVRVRAVSARMSREDGSAAVASSSQAATGARPAAALDGFSQYISMGFSHIASGWDHLAFVAVMLLVCLGGKDREPGVGANSTRGLLELAMVVTGFTLGHSLSLAAATLGVIEPNAAAVEALIGYTIAIAAFECATDRSARPWRLAITSAAVGLVAAIAAARAGASGVAWAVGGLALFSFFYLPACAVSERPSRLRVSLTTAFGLIHGLAFASVLIDMKLPTARLASALVGFNVGVELGQLAVVFAGAAVAAVMARIPALHLRTAAHTVASSACAALGVYWLFSRCLQ